MKITDSSFDIDYEHVKYNKLLKHSRTDESWIRYYHRGVPAYRFEFASYDGGCKSMQLIKFNAFCYTKNVIETIIPKGYRLLGRSDWEGISEDSDRADLFKIKLSGVHHYICSQSILFQEVDSFVGIFIMCNDAGIPAKWNFIRDLERTIITSYLSVSKGDTDRLQFERMYDLSGYPRFSIRVI